MDIFGFIANPKILIPGERQIIFFSDRKNNSPFFISGYNIATNSFLVKVSDSSFSKHFVLRYPIQESH